MISLHVIVLLEMGFGEIVETKGILLYWPRSFETAFFTMYAVLYFYALLLSFLSLFVADKAADDERCSSSESDDEEKVGRASVHSFVAGCVTRA